MNYAYQTGAISSAQGLGFAPAAPQASYPNTKPVEAPTDMQRYLEHAAVIEKRLILLLGAVEGQIGRLFGEGCNHANSDAVPQPAGMSAELASRFGEIEVVVCRLEEGISRLAQFA